MSVSKKMIESVDTHASCSILSDMYDDGEAFALDAADKMALTQGVIDAAWTEFDPYSTATFPDTSGPWLCETKYNQFMVLTWNTRTWVEQGVVRYVDMTYIQKENK